MLRDIGNKLVIFFIIFSKGDILAHFLKKKYIELLAVYANACKIGSFVWTA